MTQALSKGVSASGKYEKKILALVFNNLGAGTPARELSISGFISCNGNLTLNVSTGGNLKLNLIFLSGLLKRMSPSVPIEELVFLFDDQGFDDDEHYYPVVHFTLAANYNININRHFLMLTTLCFNF